MQSAHVSRVKLNNFAAKKDRLEYVKPYWKGSEIYRFSCSETQNFLRWPKINKLYGSFFWMGFNYLKARATLRNQFAARSLPVVLDTGPLDWESCALTTRSLLLKPTVADILKHFEPPSKKYLATHLEMIKMKTQDS